MSYTLTVQEDKETGEFYIELPYDVLVSANIDLGPLYQNDCAVKTVPISHLAW
jgi:hypothetical protein